MFIKFDFIPRKELSKVNFHNLLTLRKFSLGTMNDNAEIIFQKKKLLIAEFLSIKSECHCVGDAFVFTKGVCKRYFGE